MIRLQVAHPSAPPAQGRRPDQDDPSRDHDHLDAGQGSVREPPAGSTQLYSEAGSLSSLQQGEASARSPLAAPK